MNYWFIVGIIEIVKRLIGVLLIPFQSNKYTKDYSLFFLAFAVWFLFQILKLFN